ncbi:MAG: anthranilate phosphoribosyltransferase [Planctomycetota bacterium]|nr:anthranilate phosphoribosyltransferase [Planctomycetota bacterium]
MSPIRDILLKLCRREDLTREETRDTFSYIMSGNASEAEIGGLLVGLAAKGTTVDELVGASLVIRENVIPVPCEEGCLILDTCGTGGDVRNTFNISTAAALIVAGAGVKVVKHGNRSASGRAGSADVLEKLGLRLEVAPGVLTRCLAEANICFAYARLHHPVMKYVAGARKSLGIPTIFNVLAPMANPGRAKHQLLGVFAPELTDRLASVLRELGSKRAWVVHAEDGLDEISTLGPSRISELKDGVIHTWTLDPASLGLAYGRLSDLQISTLDDAADAISGVVDGRVGAKYDIALLNAAAGLVVAQAAETLDEGLEIAEDAVASGRAKRALELLVQISQETPRH